MWENFRLFPERASTLAGQVDALFLFMVAVIVFFMLLIGALVISFVLRYKRRTAAEVGQPVHGSTRLEIAWTVIPLAISLFLFAWGAKVFFTASRPPANAIEYYVVGKQWMWKFQHPEGKREINELHVPVGTAVKLTMTSEDVIHSFYVPAFRIKADVLPGRYTTTWFEATKPGNYHLFCAEYCGAEHSLMGGWIHVMEPAEYEAWLAGVKTGQTVVASGEEIFTQRACNTCHRPDSQVRAPYLYGLLGKQVLLRDGTTVVADENYIRESILNPQAKVVAGFEPVMPTFQGQITEEELIQLVSYVKTMQPAGADSAGAGDAAQRRR